MGGWLARLIGRRDDRGGEGGAALRLQVRCAACGEVLDVRVDTRYELRQDVEDGQDVRVLDKDLLGTRCFALLHVHALLAPDLSVRAHEVTGGQLISLSRAHD
jgi:hypothetical protein